MIGSDFFIQHYFEPTTNLQTFQIVKGSIFVLVSGVFVFFLSRYGFRKNQEVTGKLYKANEYHQMIFQKNPLPSFIIDSESLRYLKVNEAATIKMLRTEEDYLAANAVDFVVGLDREDLVHAFDSVKENGYTELYVDAINGHGKQVHEHVFCQNIQFEGRLAIFMMVLDVTHTLDKEAQLMTRMLDVLDQERTLIASEIQEGMHRYIDNAFVALTKFRKATDAGKEVTDALDHLLDLTRKGQIEGLKLTRTLVPAHGRVDDFKDVLENLVDNLNKMSKTEFDFSYQLDLAYDEDIRKNLYRIIQEACRNISVHAHASTAAIRLFERDDQLHLEVEDDGVGFDPMFLNQTVENFGMATMRTRASKINGFFSIRSEREVGTRITVIVPRAAERQIA